jgi:hypothetical protein
LITTTRRRLVGVLHRILDYFSLKRSHSTSGWNRITHSPTYCASADRAKARLARPKIATLLRPDSDLTKATEKLCPIW